jgi:hypothetical protein
MNLMQSFEFKKSLMRQNRGAISTVNLLISLLVLAVVVIAGLTVFITLNANKSQENQTNNAAVRQPATVDARQERVYYDRASGKYKTSSGIFDSSLNKLRISNELALEIKKKPSYQATVSALLVPWPNYQSDDPAVIKTQYITFLRNNLSEISAVAFDNKTNIPNTLGRLLEMLYYMAQVANSPQVSASDKATWRDSIEKGRTASIDLADGVGNMREEIKNFTVDFFKQSEFANLGIK